MDSHVREINRNLITGWLVIVGVLFVAYCGEVIKGQRSIFYLAAYMLVTALPAFYCLFLYIKKPERYSLRYWIVAGYFVMYIFTMFSGSTNMVFTYILPMLSLLVLFHQPKLILWTGAVSLIINFASIGYGIYSGKTTISNSKDAEIQIALVTLCFGGSYLATKLYDKITNENEAYTKMLDEKNMQIQKMSLQTITTIANTIDAKDEYTRGHSRRVSEYSAAIAEKLGMSPDEVSNIRWVALLHDIGKIGVPDAVLNKPGRLTNEEYQMMKQHTVIGGEILKDIGMLKGIDVGARYHHERYDGKGYPDGISGEDIPYIARIIAVADAYDAMTSNRIYRKHLHEEKVMNELKAGLGTQFDPKAGQALIELLQKGELENLNPNTTENNEMQDVTRIISRVMELQEEKMAGRLLFDQLTDAYNQSSGKKMMEDAIEDRNGCLIYFDIDSFHLINDTYGYVQGDYFLKKAAEAIKSLQDDVIVVRWGSDEFMAFFGNVTERDRVSALMTQLQDTLEAMASENRILSQMTLSAGITICDKPGEGLSDAVRKADKALYLARQQGCGLYCIYQDGSETAVDRQKSSVDLNRLVHMLEKDSKYEGGFDLTYPEFGKIYEFIRKVATRNDQHVQLLMFTLQPIEGVNIEIEERDHAMELLEKAILSKIRGVDVTTRYSSTQRIVMFMKMEEDQIELVTERIMKEFYRMYDKKQLSIHYDVAALGQESGRKPC